MCHPGIMHRGFRRAFYQAWTTVWVAGNWASTDKIVNELIFAMKKWEKVNLIVIQLILELDLTNLSCVSVFVDACSVQSCHWGDFQEGLIKLVEALSKTPGRVFACCVAQGGHCCPGCPGRTLRFTWVSDVMTLRWRRSPKLAQLHLQYKRWWRRFQCVVLLYCILRGFQKVNFPATSRKCLHPDFAQSFSFTFNAQPSEIKRGNIYNFLTKFKTVQNNFLNNQNFLKLALVIWAKFFQASYSAEQQSHLSAAPHPPTHPKQTRKNCQI